MKEGKGKQERGTKCRLRVTVREGFLIQRAVIGAVDRRHFVLCIGAEKGNDVLSCGSIDKPCSGGREEEVRLFFSRRCKK